jgi:acetyl esterase/lipase
VRFGSIEERMDDIRAVMDAVGMERASIAGWSEGGPLSLVFAATYPKRVDKLILVSTFARMLWAADYPIGFSQDHAARLLARIEARWGTGDVFRLFVQHALDHDTLMALVARWERLTATPTMAAEIMRHNLEIDVRGLLPHVHVPTLVVHTSRDPMVPVSFGRYLADHIPNCRYVEIDGDFHTSWQEHHHNLVIDPIEEFITGEITTNVSAEDRILTTILLTDIVESTRHLREVGDAQWRTILDQHDAAAAEEIGRSRGRLVDRTGDGILASFDGPARAIQCCRRLMARARALGIALRAGVHTGECELRGDRLAGTTVHLASRIMALAAPGEILATRTIRDLVVGSGLRSKIGAASA